MKIALEGFNASQQHCWLDSSVALHWIAGNGNHKQWRYINTEENPADLASRGGSVDQKDLWWRGPIWLSDSAKWPTNITTSTSPDSQAEENVLKEILKFSEVRSDDFDVLVEKFQFWKLVRVCSCIAKFADHARKSKSDRLLVPLRTGETERQVMLWVKRGARVRTGNSIVERAVQHLFPL